MSVYTYRNKYIRRIQPTKALLVLASLVVFTLLSIATSTNKSNAASTGLLFPVIGGSSFSNDFYSPRSNGLHNATDIMAAKHQPVVSATDGIITYVAYPQPAWGYMVTVRDSDGYTYEYIHLNNDNPGTDDGAGGAYHAYGPDIKRNNPIKRGQLIGYVGDSGNAENTAPHLHFEITAPDGTSVNPYQYLLSAQRINSPSTYPELANEMLPFGNTVYNSVSVASGNIMSASEENYVVGAGPGGGAHAVVFNNKTPRSQFFAYPNFYGGIDVATGDVDGDGVDEIITGAGPGGGPHVRIFKSDGTPVGGFFAYNGFYGGVNVTAGDIDGDGIDEIITGVGPGGGSHLRVFRANGQELYSMFVYNGFYGGFDVAAGDVDGDGIDEIITSAGPGGSSHIRVFKGTNPYASFYAYSGFYGGVRVSVGNVLSGTDSEEIMTAPYTAGGPDVRLFSGSGLFLGRNATAFEEWWSGGYDIAAGTDGAWVGAGGIRRATIREIF